MRGRRVACFQLVVVITAFRLMAAAGEDKSLVLHYDFNEGGGTGLKDLSGAGNDGTIHSDAAPEWVPGIEGAALNFDGNASHTWVDAGNSDSLNMTGPHSISFWVKWDGAGAGWSPLITKRPAGGGNDPQNYITFLEADGDWYYCGDSCEIWRPEPNALTGDWVHLAVTHDGVDAVKFYIGGVLVRAATVGLGAVTDGPLGIGNGLNGPANDFGAGYLDELRIFTGVLTAEEVLELSSETPAELVLHYDFDEGQGIALEDHSGRGNDGTINGRPEWVPGKAGKALSLHGERAAAFIDVRPAASLNLTRGHTISLWLKWDGRGATWSPLITKRPVDFVEPDHYSTWVLESGRFDYRNDNGVVFADTRVPLANEWVFLAVTHDGGSTVSFYINGALDSRKKLARAVANTGPLVIGSGRHLSGDFGAGTIDEVAIFARALTPEEIKRLKNHGPAGLGKPRGNDGPSG